MLTHRLPWGILEVRSWLDLPPTFLKRLREGWLHPHALLLLQELLQLLWALPVEQFPQYHQVDHPVILMQVLEVLEAVLRLLQEEVRLHMVVQPQEVLFRLQEALVRLREARRVLGEEGLEGLVAQAGEDMEEVLGGLLALEDHLYHRLPPGLQELLFRTS